MRKFVTSVLGLVVLAWSVPPADAQTILGYKLDFKEKPGFPQTRLFRVKSKEVATLESLAGDPATNGAVVQVIVQGGTSTSQTFVLPGGSRWKRSPQDTNQPAYKWRYRDSRILGYVSPVYSLELSSKGVGTVFKIAADLRGKYVPLNVAVPNPGTYAGLSIVLGGVGTYCTNFGGAAGGTFSRNDSVYFRVARPTAEGTCPSGTPVCGDNQVDAPFETCDGTNDVACPGLCGSNGLACLCPFCGDATIDPGESCDTQGNLGSCTEGCSYACACAVCGDGTVQGPVEDCEPSGVACSSGTCGLPGETNQCRCPMCGDGQATQGEQCDVGDDAACPGTCNMDTCMCAVCGNAVVEPGEECDGDGCSGGAVCQSNCTCSVCGNGIVESPPEQCEAADDSACPGLCNLDCICGVCGNNFTDYPQEQCDGTDDGNCVGSCQPDCTCP